MTTDTPPTLPATDGKRLYTTPALVVHGTVQTLTRGPKAGPNMDGDGASFNPGVDDE